MLELVIWPGVAALDDKPSVTGGVLVVSPEECSDGGKMVAAVVWVDS